MYAQALVIKTFVYFVKDGCTTFTRHADVTMTFLPVHSNFTAFGQTSNDDEHTRVPSSKNPSHPTCKLHIFHVMTI